MISSVSAWIGDRTEETGLHVTTPGALQVQGLLAEMLGGGVSHCVLETTSHGLAQHRVSACEFDIGVVTNITHEHLDYHGSYEAYRKSKGMLLAGLDADEVKPNGPAKAAVFNRDDASYSFLKKIAKVRQITFGLNRPADVVATQIESGPKGLRFVAEWERSRQTVRSPLIGEYNIANCLAAFAAAVVGLGLSPQVASKGIGLVSGIPGRMETIDLGQPFAAVVDFAHTPNALRRALETARGLTNKRVIAVFGSAGLRDRAKRRMMAEISAQLADLTVLTAEDPRTEPLDGILEEMAEGARDHGAVEGKDFWRVPDRGQALRFAVGIAQDGDLVISCGKGHEQSMCFGEVEHPWDDRVAMRAALSELMGVDGPSMPRLPTSE
jgi:UDP-N-acetylmuramoyl-L-alanyl-D-glutamate--2,6-diaminopimelate ligase